MCLVAFQKMLWKLFYGVWLCSWKYSRKHIFIRFLTFSQDPNKYYYRKSQYINTKRNKNQNHMRERKRERDQFMGDLVVVTVVATWTRWVDLKVTAWSRCGLPTVVRSRIGLFTRWSNRLKGRLLTVVPWAPGWVVHWVDTMVWSIFQWLLLSPCSIVSVLLSSLSLSWFG